MLLSALLACACLAQNTGSINGTVSLTTGGPINNATVSLENLDSGIRQQVTTDTSGNYRFQNLASGRYRLNVSTPQVAGTPSQDITLDASRPKTVNISVQANTAAPVTTASVQIEESTPSLDTTTPQIINPFNTRSIQYQAEPNFMSQTGTLFGAYNLSLQTPGVTSNGGFGVARGPVVGGQRPSSSNFYVEGIDNNNRALPGPLVYVSNEATTEFVSYTNQHPPDFGHTLGGEFNTIVRTGTNQFHGALFDYLENRNLNAVDQRYARQGITDLPRFDQNRLGANVGFPIIPNKLFFFGNFEYIPLGFSGVPGSPVLAPTAAGYATLTGLRGVSSRNLGVLQNYLGVAPTASTSTTVLGAQVPLGILPLTTQNYQNQYDGLGSLDWNISNSDQIRARYVQNEIHANNNGAQLPAFFSPRSDRSILASVSEYHNFSPTAVTEIRLGYTRFDQSVHQNNVSFPGYTFFPNIGFEDLNATLGNGIFNSPLAALNTYNASGNMNWNLGHHVVKFGVDFRRFIGPVTFPGLGNGAFTFSSVGQFLQDLPPDVGGQAAFGNFNFSGDNYDTYAYLNDSWQVSPNFNINLGASYSYVTIPSSWKLQAFNSVASVPGVLNFNEPDTQKLNFAPIVGIAYSPGFVKNVVFRAGFGMNYDTTYAQSLMPSFAPGVVSTQFVSGFPFVPGFFGSGLWNVFPVSVFTPSVTPAQAQAATTSFIPDQRVPYTMQWNAGIQGMAFHSLVLEARYLGVKAVHLPTAGFLNVNPIVTPTQNLPLFTSMPTQATLNGLTTTLPSLAAMPNNPLASSGFTSPIATIGSQGYSWYNALQLRASQRFRAGFQMQLNYTWSHLIDNLSGPTFNTLPEFANTEFLASKDSSVYDHRQRAVATMMWDVGGVGKNSPNWFRDVIANVVVGGTFTYESPAAALLQSGFNQLGGFTPAGVITNPNGTTGVGSGVTPLTNSAGQTVAYLANNPNAQFINTAPGLFAPGGRVPFNLNPINNFNTFLYKRFAIRDRFSFEIHGEAYNVLNHPQYTGASPFTIDSTSLAMRNLLIPGSQGFGDATQVFDSNARMLQVGLRLLF